MTISLMQILMAGNYDDDNSEDNSDGDDYVETGGRSDTPGARRYARFEFQPIREGLLQSCCRCSHRQQSIQFMIAGSETPCGSSPSFALDLRFRADDSVIGGFISARTLR
jgi:hypothetical protein